MRSGLPRAPMAAWHSVRSSERRSAAPPPQRRPAAAARARGSASCRRARNAYSFNARGAPGGVALITPEMRDFVDRLKLGFVATVSPDGRPNVSPRGTIMVWDGGGGGAAGGPSDELAIADIRSPETTTNVLANPEVEVCVVHPLLRRGYRLRGRAEVMREGSAEFKAAVAEYGKRGVKSPIAAVLRVRLYEASEVRSPLYDLGMAEGQIRDAWKGVYAEP